MVAVIRSVCVLHPGSQARRFVIEENAAIADAGLGDRVGTGCQGQVRAVGDWNIGPVIPGGYAHLLGNLVDAVDRSAHVRASDDDRVAGHLQDISLVLSIQGSSVDAPFCCKPLDERAVLRPRVDGPRALCRSFGPAHAGKVFPERFRRDADARQVGRVRDDGGGYPVPDQGKPSGSLSRRRNPGMIEGHGWLEKEEKAREADEQTSHHAFLFKEFL